MMGRALGLGAALPERTCSCVSAAWSSRAEFYPQEGWRSEISNYGHAFDFYENRS